MYSVMPQKPVRTKVDVMVFETAIYRGKPLDKSHSEWVYGNLVTLSDGGMAIIPSDAKVHIPGGNANVLYATECVEVDPATVGQYTGLHDGTPWEEVSAENQAKWLKNAKPGDKWNGFTLFEGDIVRNHLGFYQIIIFERGSFRFIELLDYVYGERQSGNFCACEKKMLDLGKGITADRKIGNIIDSAEIMPVKGEDWVPPDLRQKDGDSHA